MELVRALVGLVCILTKALINYLTVKLVKLITTVLAMELALLYV
jgi:hypothetical protein